MDNRQLFNALLSVETPEEMEAFLNDLCTPKELEDMSNRLEAARQLRRRETYESIHKKCGLSSTTIARINSELQYGSGGYLTVLDRLEQQQTPKDT